MNEAIKKGVKVNAGDPKKIEKGTLGSCDMKATGVRTYLKIHRYTLAECCDQITK
ncbi:TPA: hypothetical protein ACHVJ6_005391 [Bacillus cereus]